MIRKPARFHGPSCDITTAKAVASSRPCWCSGWSAAAQSPNAFGMPTADKPTAWRRHQGGARIARAGLAGAGPLRSARAPRHRRHERSAGGAGRARDPAPGRQRHRRRGRDRRGARRHVAERHRHRRRSLRARLVGEGQEALRAELRRAGRRPAGRRSSSPRRSSVKRVPGQRRQLGDGARRDLRLRRAAQALRHDDLQGDLRARGADRRRRLGAGRAPARPICAARSTACAPIPIRSRRSSIGDQAPALYSIIRNPALAKALRLIQNAGARRLLPRRDRRRDRREGAGERRRDDAAAISRSSSRSGSSRSRPTITATTSSSCRRPARASPRSRC